MKRSRTDAVLAGACALVPSCLAGSHLPDVADAAHDGGVARILGLDPQAWRSIDVVVGAPLGLVPVGTPAARAAFGGVLVVAATGVVLYFLARRLLAACADTRQLRFFVASVAAVTSLVSAPWQIEAASVGGSVTGALLVLAPVALIAEGAAWFYVAFSASVAFGQEPLVGVCACAGGGVFLAWSAERRASLVRSWRDNGALIALAWLAGLVPIGVALLRVRAAGVPFAHGFTVNWAGERGLSHPGGLGPFISREVGFVLGVFAISGCALASLVPNARPLAAALVAVALAGFASSWLGSPLGPTRFGAPVLAALAALSVLAGVAMQALVRGVASARVPMARESAAMVFILELALPADRADDALVRAAPRSSGATAAWDAAAWASLPPRGIVLVTDPVVYGRALAARAVGTLRDDVAIVPTFVHDARAWRPLATDAGLVPLWRDLELTGAPGEASLSSIAAVRPLFMSYVPEWGKPLGTHLVPASLFDRFEPEPRGATDRRRALDAFAPVRDQLAHAVSGDPELMAATATLLRSRARLLSDISSDRGLADHASADVRLFAPAE